ncbi:MAG TPA: dihydroxyacetone kinase subunit DhaL [Candidatus Limnocylindrales bacterium]|nr:dihydroxyacetone kinase subunit DhaL [Candidatus Limnocylindrales bacterium]
MSTRIAGDDGADHETAIAASTLLTASDLRDWVSRCARILVRHRAYLDRLDARLGDGDHGENMAVGFGDAARALQPDDDGREAGELLRRLGEMLVAGVGGAGGSLYGTAFMEAGIAVVGRPGLGPGDLAVALDAAAEGIARRGRCRGGDKTIYDALRPAADAVAAAVGEGLDLEGAIRRGAVAARAGMLATRPLIARRGLALRLGERSRGHQDPGATSCFLLMRAMLPERAR